MFYIICCDFEMGFFFFYNVGQVFLFLNTHHESLFWPFSLPLWTLHTSYTLKLNVAFLCSLIYSQILYFIQNCVCLSPATGTKGWASSVVAVFWGCRYLGLSFFSCFTRFFWFCGPETSAVVHSEIQWCAVTWYFLHKDNVFPFFLLWRSVWPP